MAPRSRISEAERHPEQILVSKWKGCCGDPGPFKAGLDWLGSLEQDFPGLASQGWTTLALPGKASGP